MVPGTGIELLKNCVAGAEMTAGYLSVAEGKDNRIYCIRMCIQNNLIREDLGWEIIESLIKQEKI